MLTPDQLDKLKQSQNPTVSPGADLSDDTSYQNWVNRAVAKSTSTPDETETPGWNPTSEKVLGDVVGGTGDLIKGTIQNTKDIQKSSAQDFMSDVSSIPKNFSDAGTALRKGDIGGALNSGAKGFVQGGLGTLSDALSFVMAPLTGAIKTGTDVNAEGISDIPGVQKASMSPAGDAVQAVKDNMDKLQRENPTKFKAVTDAMNVLGFTYGAMKAPEIGGMAEKGLTDLGGDLSKGGNLVKNVAGKVEDVGTNVAGGVSDLTGKTIEGTKNYVKNKIGNDTTPERKTLDEVLATPEDKVPNLYPDERAAYWRNKSDMASTEDMKAKIDIKQKASESLAKIDEASKKQSETSIKQTQDLKNEVEKVSNEEAASYKPKAQQLYKTNSAQFGKLFDEAFTPEKQTIPLKQSDLASRLDAEFSDNPKLNPKEKLGIDSSSDKPITAKEFYDRVRSLKTTASGSKGTSTFTNEDLVINRTRGVLTDILKENGVDLGNANKFWSEWKPLQREITAKVKPFNEYKTGQMATVLKDSASIKGDSKNTQFISDFEEQLGEKIGGKTRTAMEKLTNAQKQAIADKVAVEEAKVKIAEEKQSALENQKNKSGKIEKDIYKRKFASEQDAASIKEELKKDSDRRARNRSILKWALGTVIPGIALEGAWKIIN